MAKCTYVYEMKRRWNGDEKSKSRWSVSRKNKKEGEEAAMRMIREDISDQQSDLTDSMVDAAPFSAEPEHSTIQNMVRYIICQTICVLLPNE